MFPLVRNIVFLTNIKVNNYMQEIWESIVWNVEEKYKSNQNSKNVTDMKQPIIKFKIWDNFSPDIFKDQIHH